MKYIKQFSIIIFVSLLGEIFHFCIPLPIPASIYGLVLMFAALQSGILKVEQIRETSDFLIEIMPIMFIPAAIGLIAYIDMLKANLLAYIVVIVGTTYLVMGVSGHVTQWIVRRKDNG